MGNKQNQNDINELIQELSECFNHFLDLNAKNIVSTAESLHVNSVNSYKSEMKKVEYTIVFLKLSLN
jgi:hypothetical protein